MQELRSQVHLPVQPCGALLVAWSEAELAKLPAIAQKAHDNGVTNVRRVSREELYSMEPSLASHALGAVHVPDEMLVDPLSLPLILLQHARLLGLRVFRSARVEDLELETLTWTWRVTLSGPGAAAAAKAKELEAYRGDGPRKVENATAVLHARYVVRFDFVFVSGAAGSCAELWRPPAQCACRRSTVAACTAIRLRS